MLRVSFGLHRFLSYHPFHIALPRERLALRELASACPKSIDLIVAHFAPLYCISVRDAIDIHSLIYGAGKLIVIEQQVNKDVNEMQFGEVGFLRLSVNFKRLGEQIVLESEYVKEMPGQK